MFRAGRGRTFRLVSANHLDRHIPASPVGGKRRLTTTEIDSKKSFHRLTLTDSASTPHVGGNVPMAP